MLVESLHVCMYMCVCVYVRMYSLLVDLNKGRRRDYGTLKRWLDRISLYTANHSQGNSSLRCSIASYVRTHRGIPNWRPLEGEKEEVGELIELIYTLQINHGAS